MDQYQKRLNRQELRLVRKAIKEQIEKSKEINNEFEKYMNEKIMEELKTKEKDLIKYKVVVKNTLLKLENSVKTIKKYNESLEWTIKNIPRYNMENRHLLEENNKAIKWYEEKIKIINSLTIA